MSDSEGDPLDAVMRELIPPEPEPEPAREERRAADRDGREDESPATRVCLWARPPP
jgi:hypothetical protein